MKPKRFGDRGKRLINSSMGNKANRARYDGRAPFKASEVMSTRLIAWVEIPDAAVISGAGNEKNHLPEQEHL